MIKKVNMTMQKARRRADRHLTSYTFNLVLLDRNSSYAYTFLHWLF